MKKRFYLALLVAFALFVLSGCGSKTIDLVGSWTSDDPSSESQGIQSLEMSFSSSGYYYGKMISTDGSEPLEIEGDYTLNGNTIHVNRKYAKDGEKENLTYKYSVIDNNTIEFMYTDNSSIILKRDLPEEVQSPSPTNSSEGTGQSNTANVSATFTGKEYKPGMYKIGVDMPAGEYVLNPSGKSGAYVEISSDSSGNSIIDNDNFDLFCYVSVKDGEYLTLQGCSAYEESGVKNLVDFNGGLALMGTYKVGKDLPAGEYKVKLLKGSTSGYYEVNAAPIGSASEIINNGIIEGDAYVTLEDGQYIKLQDCFISLN